MPVSEDGRCPVGADSGKTVAGLSGRGEMWGAAAWGGVLEEGVKSCQARVNCCFGVGIIGKGRVRGGSSQVLRKAE